MWVNYVGRLCGSTMWVDHLGQLCRDLITKNMMPCRLFTSTVYINCLRQQSTSTVYINHLRQLFTPHCLRQLPIHIVSKKNNSINQLIDQSIYLYLLHLLLGNLLCLNCLHFLFFGITVRCFYFFRYLL